MKGFKTRSLLLILPALLLAACSSVTIQPLATPTPAPTEPPPSATPTVTPVPSQTPAPTITPTLAPSLTPTEPPELIPMLMPKGPILLYVGDGSGVRVVWEWIEDAAFQVEWGQGGRYDLGSAEVRESSAETHSYLYDITGLEPGQRYEYRVRLNLSAAVGSFISPPAADASGFKFVSYGDTRTNPDAHEEVTAAVARLYQVQPEYQTLNLFLGDFVTAGDNEAFWEGELFYPPMIRARGLQANLPMLPVIGNHEGGGLLFQRFFPIPWVKARYGSFDYGPAHIAVVDQYVPFGPDSNQNTWLEQDLTASTKPWKFVMMHEPGWSAAGGHDNNATAQALQPLFERTGVQLVLAGHNHYYARAEVNGITHLTIGTGGAPLYTPIPGMPNLVASYSGYGFAAFEAAGDTLTGRFLAADGSLVDEFSIPRVR